MRALPWGLALLLSVSLLPLQAEAAKKKTSHKQAEAPATVAAPVPAPPAQAPADFADAFHEAMRSLNRAQILSMLAPDLVVFETGYLKATRDEYVKTNLSDDADFASVTDYRPLSRGVIGSGEQVVVLTKASIQGIFGDQRVDLEQSETMILRRTPTNWEIVHLHWSAHPRQVNDSEPQVTPVAPAPHTEPAPAPAPAPVPVPQTEPVPASQAEPEPPAFLKPATELTAPSETQAKPDQ